MDSLLLGCDSHDLKTCMFCLLEAAFSVVYENR